MTLTPVLMESVIVAPCQTTLADVNSALSTAYIICNKYLVIIHKKYYKNPVLVSSISIYRNLVYKLNTELLPSLYKMNIYTTLFLYVFLLLNNNIVDSLKLQFTFNNSKKINDKDRYWLLKVNEHEGHYFFFGHARCSKIVADGTTLWKVKQNGMCPGGVSYYGTDEVAINFPEELLFFKKSNGEWVKTTPPNETVKGNLEAAVIESDQDAKNKKDHPAAEEIQLPVKSYKEPDYDLPRDIKIELTTDCYKQKTQPSEEQVAKPTQPEPAQSVAEDAEDSSATPAAPESGST
ncbi:conserved hypothetical protein [Theileria orientalis strain Shintoku]|uniref:Uncharacterized protein n=1 Tax=Theileria orientalis strain Shintoku TaxID=869250 RepID=J4CD42_THEOR|nr:conserved hypothetical protein [Theileria orientalis strain Shintoku]BAM40487.1 conserved hypothetical protein [Theileria orientalis strain Shintoku]|eukprot:XP_009690788.1 conserved hypothetical protein [Theileria orientalis strain Shintoku]